MRRKLNRLAKCITAAALCLALSMDFSAPAKALNIDIKSVFKNYIEKHNADYSYYSTDIVTNVNGTPIDAINIGGKTLISAEDMFYHGFDVVWNGEASTLRITKGGGQIGGGPEVKKSNLPSGTRLGSYQKTDIVTYLDGIPIEAYNTGGRTYICAEDMEQFGYTVNWDGVRSILSVFTSGFGDAPSTVLERSAYGDGDTDESGSTGSDGIPYSLSDVNRSRPPVNTVLLNADGSEALFYLASTYSSNLNNRQNNVYAFCPLGESSYRSLSISFDKNLQDGASSAEISVRYENQQGSRTSYMNKKFLFPCTLSTCDDNARHIIGSFTATVHQSESSGGSPDLVVSGTFHIDASKLPFQEASAVYTSKTPSGLAAPSSSDFDTGSSSSGPKTVVHICKICGSDNGKCMTCNGRGFVEYNGLSLNAPKTIECRHCMGNKRCPNYSVTFQY